jgi:hypothetical protein
MSTIGQTFENATTQRDLTRIAIHSASLSAAEWIGLARDLTGIACRSGRSAGDTVHTHFSDRLLLQERIAAVHRSCSS